MSSRIRTFLRWMFRRAHLERDMNSELESYIAMYVEDRVREGMDRDVARRQAQIELGGVEQTKECIRGGGPGIFIETCVQDLWYGLRGLGKAPAFAAIAILTIALGIGSNTAMFTILGAVLLNPLPYPNADELVHLSLDTADPSLDHTFTMARVDHLRSNGAAFTGVASYLGHAEDVTFVDDAGNGEVLRAARVAGNFLDVLGVAPTIGRPFNAEESVSGGADAALISTRMWRRRFGSAPSVTGSPAILDARVYTIVGVLPEGFAFPFSEVDVWIPRPTETSMLEPRFQAFAPQLAVARLRPGVSVADAQRELEVVNSQYEMAFPTAVDARANLLRLDPLRDQVVGNAEAAIWVLFAAVVLFLFIACANVAGLLLARTTARQQEFAVRASLGASRSRLIRQSLTESLLVACSGGAIGAGFTWFALEIWTGSVLSALPRATEIQPDVTVLLFAVATSVGSALAFGVLPAVRSAGGVPTASLRVTAAAGTPGGHSPFGVLPQRFLVAFQTALTLILLIGTSLLVRSVGQLSAVDYGFDTAGLLTMRIPLPTARYDTAERRSAFYATLANRVTEVPGVESASIVRTLPTTTGAMRTNFGIAGRPGVEPAMQPQAVVQTVTPGYAGVLGIRVLGGRNLRPEDAVPGAPPVALINDSFVRTHWPDAVDRADVVGQRIGVPAIRTFGIEIVGVLDDVLDQGPGSGTPPTIYVPQNRYPPQTGYLIARVAGPPELIADPIQDQVRTIDPGQSVADVQSMDALLAGTSIRQRWVMRLLGTFSAIALFLALAGIYGVLSYTVAQRTREFGIRRALGAEASTLLGGVLFQNLIVILSGVVAGLIGALSLTRFLDSLLFEVGPTDPVVFVAIPVLMTVVALGAGIVPAVRAARVHPMVSLRHD